jgi:hypothetical protein
MKDAKEKEGSTDGRGKRKALAGENRRKKLALRQMTAEAND